MWMVAWGWALPPSPGETATVLRMYRYITVPATRMRAINPKDLLMRAFYHRGHGGAQRKLQGMTPLVMTIKLFPCLNRSESLHGFFFSERCHAGEQARTNRLTGQRDAVAVD